MSAIELVSTMICSTFQHDFKDKLREKNEYNSPKAMLVSLRLHHKRDDPALKMWHCGDFNYETEVVCDFVGSKDDVEKHAASLGAPHCVEECYFEDYYPHVDILIWAPSNYVKVFVRERDVHHFGAGTWVKIYDHDSCWREGVDRIVRVYADGAYSFDTFDGWFEQVDVHSKAIGDLPNKLEQIEKAAVLPGIYRNKA